MFKNNNKKNKDVFALFLYKACNRSSNKASLKKQ